MFLDVPIFFVNAPSSLPPALGSGRSPTTGPVLPRPALTAARRGPVAVVAAATVATAAAEAGATVGATAGAGAAAGAAARAEAGAEAGAGPAATTATIAAAATTAPGSERNMQTAQEGEETQTEERLC